MFTSWTRCNSKMDATNTVQSWGHPQSDSLGSYKSSEIGSKLSKHGIHLDRFFRDGHALCTCICVLWAFPKTIDAHSICLWYSVCPMSMPIRPVGIPIMSCALSHYAQWAFPLCPVGTPNPPISYCVPYTGYLQPALWAYLHGDPYALWAFPSCPWHSLYALWLFLYALWAFTLRPVGIHIIPRGHCQVGIPTPISYCVPYACGLQYAQHTPMDIHMPSGHSPYALWVFQSCPVGIPNSHRRPGVFSDMVFSQTLKSAWIWIRSWKLLDFPICLENYHFFLENCLKMTLVGLKN